MISKRWLINYLLIILIVVFSYIGKRYEVQTGQQTRETVSQLKPQEINRISIQTADDAITMKKTGTQWSIESPISWPANNINVERILGITNTEFDSSLSAEEIDLSTLGLEFPNAILTLNDTRFLFGATNNIGERRYLLTESTVYLLADIHLHFFRQGLPGLVDRRLLPRSVTLQSLNLGKFILNKTSDGDWQANDDTITPDQLSEVINNWQTLEASNIKVYQKSDIPRQKIRAELMNGNELEFFLMSISPEIVIARPDLGLQFHFSESQFYGLLAVRQ